MNDKYGEQQNTLFGIGADGRPANLPELDLPRVFIITSGNTCSASESIINSLRGIGVEVIQIGSQTCGKPYGFYPQDNCGTTYFSIQFKGVNEKGFGEYSDGFVPSASDNGMDLVKGCSLGDDLSHVLGDPTEKNLATALSYQATGSCTLASGITGAKLQKMSSDNVLSDVMGSLNKAPGLTNRIMK
jgi:carboxyl-terminal processing protease